MYPVIKTGKAQRSPIVQVKGLFNFCLHSPAEIIFSELRSIGSELGIVPCQGNDRQMNGRINIGMLFYRYARYQPAAKTERPHFENIVAPIIEMLETAGQQPIGLDVLS